MTERQRLQKRIKQVNKDLRDDVSELIWAPSQRNYERVVKSAGKVLVWNDMLQDLKMEEFNKRNKL